jgi:glyceraldehyde-3-phosphate dehydrogenase (NADP+)
MSASKTGARRPVYSPYDGRIVGESPISTRADAESSVAAAHEAFAATRLLPSHERYRILRAIQDGIAARRDEFARCIADEAGKPIRDARVEVDRAVLVFSLAADEARRIGGEVLPLDLNAASNGRLGITRRFPCGVVAGITPFNFPLNLVAHKVAPAFAAGCPLILKPAEKTPLTALKLTEVVRESGWPEGGFAVLTPETPAEIGNLLATDERITVFSFTGSARVGWDLKAKANRKRVILELGGNAAVIVEPDADLDFAVSRCVVGGFANAGQVCISVQRIFVHRTVFDTFTARYVEGVKALKVGDPADEATDIGPMITGAACEQAEKWVAEAIQGGATVLLQGNRTLNTSLLSPTILTGTQPTMAVCREEVFAPVVVVEPYDDFEAALASVNNSRYGLQAGVFTRDVNKLFRAFEVLRVGGVIGNDVPQYRVDNMPYGGEKDSGFGREGIRYAIEEMTELRLLALRLE